MALRLSHDAYPSKASAAWAILLLPEPVAPHFHGQQSVERRPYGQLLRTAHREPNNRGTAMTYRVGHRIYCNQGSSAQRLATPLYPGYPNGLQLRGSRQHRAKKISRRGIYPRRMRIRSYWLWAYFRPLRR